MSWTTMPISRETKIPACEWKHLKPGESINVRPDQDVGLLTGTRSDVVIVDYDPRDDPDGSSWALLQSLGIPETYTTQTRNSGAHFYFVRPTLPPEFYAKSSCGKTKGIAPGIDVKADGGYCKIPPSEGYSVARNAPIAPCPAWLLRPWPLGVVAPIRAKREPLHDTPITASPRLRAIAESALANALSAIEEQTKIKGGGNTLLAQKFFMLAGFGASGALSQEECFAPTMKLIETWDDVDRHLETMQHAWEAGLDEPFDEPPVEPTLFEVVYPEKKTPVVSSDSPVTQSRLVRPRLSALCAKEVGARLRIPTGMPELDRFTFGGFRSSELALVGGAPGGNKTSLLAFLAFKWARDGVETENGREQVDVAIVACDEARSGFLSRFGQICGVDRECLDAENVERSRLGWDYVAPRLAEIDERLTVYDPREEPCSVEGAAHELARSPIARRVLIIDSLQSSDGYACDDPREDSPRLRIDGRLRMLLALCRQLKISIIGSSELARSAYAKGGEGPDLASMKESGKTEYAADQAFSVVRISGTEIDLRIMKTRHGETGASVRILRNERLEFSEAPTVAKTSDLDGDVDLVVNAVRKEIQPISSVDAISRLAGISATRGRSAVSVAVARGLIRSIGPKRDREYSATRSSSDLNGI